MASFVREMVIQRVRNPQDSSMWVDIAVTVKYTVQNGRGRTFMRNIYFLSTMQLGDPTEQSEPFVVTTRSDLVVAAAAFAAQHPD